MKIQSLTTVLWSGMRVLILLSSPLLAGQQSCNPTLPPDVPLNPLAFDCTVFGTSIYVPVELSVQRGPGIITAGPGFNMDVSASVVFPPASICPFVGAGPQAFDVSTATMTVSIGGVSSPAPAEVVLVANALPVSVNIAEACAGVGAQVDFGPVAVNVSPDGAPTLDFFLESDGLNILFTNPANSGTLLSLPLDCQPADRSVPLNGTTNDPEDSPRVAFDSNDDSAYDAWATATDQIQIGVSGYCVGYPCDDGNDCTVDQCDYIQQGNCSYTNAPDGTVCSTGGATGICSSGSCELDVCGAEPIIRTTVDGVEFVRTPDACFENLPDFPYELKHVDIDGLRQGYVDEGPAGGPVVLLLHGQPTWSFLYRKMIPILVGAGYRTVAMDHLGTGYSDKPIDIADYSYLGHIDRLEQFINALGLSDITLFAQDWGSVIGLHVAGENPDWFARIVIGDGNLPVIPAGVVPYPPVQNPNEIDPNLPTPFPYPAQQVPFYDGCTLLPGVNFNFPAWMEYAMKAEAFHAAEAVEAATWFDMPTEDEAAYDAPFPSRIYMAGIRVFPSLANEMGGVNQNAWASLQQFAKPFLTIWADNDPIRIGSCATQDRLINNIPGAACLPHTRLPEASHFLQDDQGAEIANRIVALMSTTQ